MRGGFLPLTIYYFQMKRLLPIIFLISFFYCHAQQPSEHLKFMGRPIAGSSELFISFLEEKGFVKTGEFENSYSFMGKFANEIVNLTLLASPKTNTVCKVIVYFPEYQSWSDLKSDYFKKKNLYKSKYLITDEFEFFSSPYDEGDGYEMRAIAQDKCKFVSFYKDFGGHITVEVCPKFCVKVVYEDDYNIKVAKSELESKAFDDI